MIRVLVAEDSATIRELLLEILGSEPGIRVVGSARDGEEAIEMAKRLRPDVVTMDIEMPRVDGFEATKEIMIEAPTRIVIVSSTSAGNLEMALNATRAGALMVLPTPTSPGSSAFERDRAELIRAVRAMAQVKVVRHWRHGAHAARPIAPTRRAAGTGTVRIIAIAASTGGPAALQRVLMDLPRDLPVPILIVQHIARGFTEGLCTWLAGSCGLRVRIAKHREMLEPHSVYIAPDDQHLGVDAEGRAVLSNALPVDGFRPSANVLFSSVARAYGDSAVAVVLTGMGRDGVEGARALHAAGGRVIAQDEETSVVYGMPKEAVGAGIVASILPIQEIAPKLIELIARKTA